MFFIIILTYAQINSIKLILKLLRHVAVLLTNTHTHTTHHTHTPHTRHTTHTTHTPLTHTTHTTHTPHTPHTHTPHTPHTHHTHHTHTPHTHTHTTHTHTHTHTAVCFILLFTSVFLLQFLSQQLLVVILPTFLRSLFPHHSAVLHTLIICPSPHPPPTNAHISDLQVLFSY